MNTKTYWCVDCPEGPMTEAEARCHAHHRRGGLTLMRIELINANDFLASLRVGETVIITIDGRDLEVTVQRPLRRPDPGGFGSTEASWVTVGYGPGRWNREVTVEALANGTVSLRRP